jgi:PPOX class probable F420-dependent enzyme
VYPQMPPLTESELADFLAEAPIARLATHNPDGTVHLAPVYFEWDGTHLLVGTQDTTRKVRNIRSDPRVTVLIDNQSPPWRGVLIYGEASIQHDDAIPTRVRIFSKYMAEEKAGALARGLAHSYPPAVIRIHPTRIVSYDYSKPGFIQAAMGS